jgi:hypothetical protein
MHWIKAIVHRTFMHPERSLRRLERQIVAYQARQAHLETAIQRLCAQHLAIQLQLRRQQRQQPALRSPQPGLPDTIPVTPPGAGGAHAPIG